MAVALRIVVRLQFEGVHSWPQAPEQHVLLSYPHRHMFHVEAVKEVTHTERDIEFIAFKNMLQDYCEGEFGGFNNHHTLSCETMALRLLKEFNLKRCSVFEDNENGAEVEETA